MSGFGTLWRIRTGKNIRSQRSVATGTSSSAAAWPRSQETEQLRLEAERLQARRRLHQRRQAGWIK